jgi:hypothetical protein
MHVPVMQVTIGNPLETRVSIVGTIPSEPRELCNGNTGFGELAVGTLLGTLSENVCGTHHVERGRKRHWERM